MSYGEKSENRIAAFNVATTCREGDCVRCID